MTSPELNLEENIFSEDELIARMHEQLNEQIQEGTLSERHYNPATNEFEDYSPQGFGSGITSAIASLLEKIRKFFKWVIDKLVNRQKSVAAIKQDIHEAEQTFHQAAAEESHAPNPPHASATPADTHTAAYNHPPSHMGAIATHQRPKPSGPLTNAQYRKILLHHGISVDMGKFNPIKILHEVEQVLVGLERVTQQLPEVLDKLFQGGRGITGVNQLEMVSGFNTSSPYIGKGREKLYDSGNFPEFFTDFYVLNKGNMDSHGGQTTFTLYQPCHWGSMPGVKSPDSREQISKLREFMFGPQHPDDAFPAPSAEEWAKMAAESVRELNRIESMLAKQSRAFGDMSKALEKRLLAASHRLPNANYAQNYMSWVHESSAGIITPCLLIVNSLGQVFRAVQNHYRT